MSPMKDYNNILWKLTAKVYEFIMYINKDVYADIWRNNNDFNGGGAGCG